MLKIVVTSRFVTNFVGDNTDDTALLAEPLVQQELNIVVYQTPQSFQNLIFVYSMRSCCVCCPRSLLLTCCLGPLLPSRPSSSSNIVMK